MKTARNNVKSLSISFSIGFSPEPLEANQLIKDRNAAAIVCVVFACASRLECVCALLSGPGVCGRVRWCFAFLRVLHGFIP